MDANNVITLCVGGRTFQALQSTLCNIPYFAGLFRSGMALPEFIDRNPDAFESILNHARDARYAIPLKFAPDADYYGYDVCECDEIPALENTLSAMSHGGERPISHTGSVSRFEFRYLREDTPKLFVVSFRSKDMDSAFDCVKSITYIIDGLNKIPYKSARLYWLNKIAFNDKTEEWLNYRKKVFNEYVLLVDLRSIMPWPFMLQIDIQFNGQIYNCTARFQPPDVFFTPCQFITHFIIFHDDDERKSIPAPADAPFDATVAKLKSLRVGLECREHVYALTATEQQSIIEYQKRVPSKFTLLPY